jgi:hypothetical protein
MGRVMSEGSQNNVSINHNWLLPVSSLKEKSLLPLILDGPLQSYCFSFQSDIQYGCQGQ